MPRTIGNGYSTYADSTLMTISKKELISIIRLLEGNLRTLSEQPTVAGQCKDCNSADFCRNSGLVYCLEHSCVMEPDGFCNCFQSEVE